MLFIVIYSVVLSLLIDPDECERLFFALGKKQILPLLEGMLRVVGMCSIDFML